MRSAADADVGRIRIKAAACSFAVSPGWLIVVDNGLTLTTNGTPNSALDFDAPQSFISGA
jgi:hypothetical protein